MASPASVPPRSCPGGIVIHVYSVPAGDLVHVSRLHPDDDVEGRALAELGAVAAKLGQRAMLMVAYDGDTGGRMERGLAGWLT